MTPTEFANIAEAFEREECNFCGATTRKLVDFNGSLTWACPEHAGTFSHDPRTIH